MRGIDQRNWSLSSRAAAICGLTLLGGFAQSAHADSNLQTCLDGRYPALCNKSQLTPDQVRLTVAAERRANLASCLEGRYPALCRHGDLSASETESVRTAEHAANLQICLDGRYPALCRHA